MIEETPEVRGMPKAQEISRAGDIPVTRLGAVQIRKARRRAAEMCWTEFEFSLPVAEANGWEDDRDMVRRKAFFDVGPGKDTVAADFVCIFARGTAAVLACGIDAEPNGKPAHPDMKSDLLPTIFGSLKTVRDLADLGRLNPDDRLISGDGETLWHEAKRQEGAVAILDDLLETYGTNLDRFASLPVIALRLGAEGLPETDLDEIRHIAPGSPVSAAVATCLELACQQIDNSRHAPATHRYLRDVEAIDIAGAFWLACGDEVCRLAEPAADNDAPAPA